MTSYSTTQCTNCSQIGHTSKYCPQPITSYGVILFRVQDAFDQAEALAATRPRAAATGFEHVHPKLQILLIQRRDSIGYIEIMRGKYRLSDTAYIRSLFEGMTALERGRLATLPFARLWEELWGQPSQGGHSYRHEKEQARMKLDALRSEGVLATILESLPGAWPTPEWGFPKGRRDLNESEYACAMREMEEETNIREDQIQPVRGLEPLVERFCGSNNVQYCHKYYLAYAPPELPEVNFERGLAENEHMRREIGGLRWMTLEEAVQVLRPEQAEKKALILRIGALLRGYCPLRLRPAAA